MTRRNISVNASSLAVAQSIVRTQMQRDRLSGRVTGGARAAIDRPDDTVSLYTTEPNRVTWIVYVDR